MNRLEFKLVFFNNLSYYFYKLNFTTKINIYYLKNIKIADLIFKIKEIKHK